MSITVDQRSVPATTAKREPQRSVPPAHLDGIDGLRGLAALLVVIFHLYLENGMLDFRPWHHINILRPLNECWCGVNLFLVISGFCLFWPYARDPKRRLDVADFMRRRVRRIVPAYYASLVIVPVISFFIFHNFGTLLDTNNRPHSIIDGVQNYVAHLLFLHSLFPKTIYSLNGVYWSLGLEWIWYLAFPLCVLLYRRHGAIAGLLTLACISLSYGILLRLLLGPASHFHSNWVSVSTLWCFLPGRIFEFGAGMFVAWILANFAVTKGIVRCCLALVPLTLFMAHEALHFDTFIQINNMLYGLAFALLLLAVGSPESNIARKVFNLRFLRGIGEYSYSLYLYHVPVIWALYYLLHLKLHQSNQTFFISLLFFPVILVVAKLAYLAFERPFMHASKKKIVVDLAAAPKQSTSA